VGIPSGILIEEVGMKGQREGGAQVAPWHANFLINAQGATAQDVLVLAGRIKDKVFIEKGIKLEEEVLFLS
jgi:UDP-N-acetylmuramate dehydrogenase